MLQFIFKSTLENEGHGAKVIKAQRVEWNSIIFFSREQQKVCNIKKTDEHLYFTSCLHEIVSEYDQEIPQSQTADNPMAPRGRATQSSRDTRETN